jgi:hypothetical protein
MSGTAAVLAKSLAIRFGIPAIKSIASKWWAKRKAKKAAKRALKAVRGDN